jgi:hypothetical protein
MRLARRFSGGLDRGIPHSHLLLGVKARRWIRERGALCDFLFPRRAEAAFRSPLSVSTSGYLLLFDVEESDSQ